MQRRDFAKSAIFGVPWRQLCRLPAGRRAPIRMRMWCSRKAAQDIGRKQRRSVPEITVAGGKLTIKTPHPTSEAHYIVSHTVVLADGTFVGRKTFTYKDEPISEHTLPAGYTGKVTVTSTCNQHDVWVKSISV